MQSFPKLPPDFPELHLHEILWTRKLFSLTLDEVGGRCVTVQ